MLTATNDPIFRVVTLAALCKAYRQTECRLLERVIRIMQRDTRIWLRQHPEYVHSFCDAFYDRRDEINQLAAEMPQISDDHGDCFAHNGIWTILGQRYESRQRFESRLSDAGYITTDVDSLLEKRCSAETIKKMDAKIEANRKRFAAEIAAGRDQDWAMNYLFWLPDREEDYGEFTVAIPRKRMDRIGDYRMAGGKFPAREYTDYFNELLATNVISAVEHENLRRWVAYESLPTPHREAMKAQSDYRPFTDLPEIAKFQALVSDFDGESDALDDSDLPSIVLSRREAARIIEALDRHTKPDEGFRTMMNKLRGSHDESDDPE